MKFTIPADEMFLDFEGKERVFEFRIFETGVGMTLQAREKSTDGYEFEAFSSSNLFVALGELRQKIRKRISTRYLRIDNQRLCFYHDEARGQITSGGVVIDGVFVSFEQLASILQGYEGFLFDLRIRELSDE